MTFKEKLNENMRLVKGYDAFLFGATLSFDKRLRLITEIGRLQAQIEWIREMKVSEFEEEFYTYNIATIATI